MAKKDLSGLDLKGAIDFYRRNSAELLKRLPGDANNTDIQYDLDKPDCMAVTPSQINALINLFPRQARERFYVDAIRGYPTVYFRRDYAPGREVTFDATEAISETAIVPSFIPDHPDGHIGIFRIPESVIPEEIIRRIIHSQGLVHELVHSLAKRAKSQGTEQIQLPSSRIVNTKDYLLGLREILEEHAPISAYSSAFRLPNGKLDDNEGRLFQSIDENLAEIVTAHLLGFSFCDDDSRGLNPFADRKGLVKLAQDYLSARKV